MFNSIYSRKCMGGIQIASPLLTAAISKPLIHLSTYNFLFIYFIKRTVFVKSNDKTL